jgi:hypothetical protein
MSKSRVLASSALAGVLVVAGLSAGPAFAEDPPLVWTTVEGYPVTTSDEEVSVSVETATLSADAIGTLTDFPIQRIEIVNDSDDTRYFHFGVDVDLEGVIEPLWEEETLGQGSWTTETLAVTLLPHQSIVDTDAVVYHGFESTFPGIPVYPGRTIAVYELDADPSVVPSPGATEIARLPVAPGDFVPVRFDDPVTSEGTVPAGQELTVVGPDLEGQDVELFPGVTATATGDGLPANREMELWLVPGFDYFYAVLLGGILPDTALPAGTTTTSAGGVLDAPFTVPSDAVFNTQYRLLAGDLETRTWNAGTYRPFTITSAPASGEYTAAPEETQATIPLGAESSVDFIFPEGTGGTWTAAVSTTGPVVSEFTLAGDPPLYYHLDTTASLGGTEVEVCITYNESNLPGEPPRLYHLVPVAGAAYGWEDITTFREPGKVCGVTSSFSPFALGFPDEFEFSGFLAPVSDDGENLAKPGQAIPVKFSLNGDQGLDVVTSARFIVEGTDSTPEGEPIAVTTVGGSGLTYDAATDTYTYVWKTSKDLSLKTGRFELILSDDTAHTFQVNFKK